jgi:hypothetical protein
MSATLTQLKAAYEVNNMTIDEICREFSDLEPSAIKAGLMQVSTKYRKDCGRESEDEDASLNFSDDDLRMVNQGIRDIALSAEDEHLRFKALVYIRDDKKGRKEVVKAMKSNNFNILQINQAIRQARAVGDTIKQRLIEA